MIKTQGWILVGLGVVAVLLLVANFFGENKVGSASSNSNQAESNLISSVSNTNHLTPLLTPFQFEQNLDAIISTATSTGVLEAYIGLYQRNSSGNFVLINS